LAAVFDLDLHDGLVSWLRRVQRGSGDRGSARGTSFERNFTVDDRQK
jgi:hypothetical protein